MRRTFIIIAALTLLALASSAALEMQNKVCLLLVG